MPHLKRWATAPAKEGSGTVDALVRHVCYRRVRRFLAGGQVRPIISDAAVGLMPIVSEGPSSTHPTTDGTFMGGLQSLYSRLDASPHAYLPKLSRRRRLKLRHWN